MESFRGKFVAFGQETIHEDYSQTGSSGLAPAPPLPCPAGHFVNNPQNLEGWRRGLAVVGGWASRPRRRELSSDSASVPSMQGRPESFGEGAKTITRGRVRSPNSAERAQSAVLAQQSIPQRSFIVTQLTAALRAGKTAAAARLLRSQSPAQCRRCPSGCRSAPLPMSRRKPERPLRKLPSSPVATGVAGGRDDVVEALPLSTVSVK